MNRWKTPGVKSSAPSLLMATLVLSTKIARGQEFAVDWFRIDGGGGTTAGGPYSLSGTIGQPDAGQMSGGNYTLDEGLWSILATAQSPPAPSLTIRQAGANITLSWPSPSTGFVLEQSSVLAPASWSTVSPTPADDGVIRSVTLPASGGTRFFRLRRP
jgi:hypothetical protein